MNVGDFLVGLEPIAHQKPNRKNPVEARSDVHDGREGRIENQRADIVARGESDRDTRAKGLAHDHKTARRDAKRKRLGIGRFAVKVESGFRGRSRRGPITAIFHREQAIAGFGQFLKADIAKTETAAIAVKIKNERLARRRRDVPRDQRFAVWRFQIQDARLRQADISRRDFAALREVEQLTLENRQAAERDAVKRKQDKKDRDRNLQ
jgi:hypothetical protein